MPPEPSCAIHHGDNLPILRGLASASFELIYIDPPLNKWQAQARTRTKSGANSGDSRKIE